VDVGLLVVVVGSLYLTGSAGALAPAFCRTAVARGSCGGVERRQQAVVQQRANWRHTA